MPLHEAASAARLRLAAAVERASARSTHVRSLQRSVADVVPVVHQEFVRAADALGAKAEALAAAVSDRRGALQAEMDMWKTRELAATERLVSQVRRMTRMRTPIQYTYSGRRANSLRPSVWSRS